MATINVKTDFGAVGDGNTDDTDAIQAALDEAYGTADAPHGGSEGRFANRAVYFPNGWYITSAPLTLHEVAGAHIYGEGRLSTTIQNNTPGSSVFVTNGFMYSKIERLALVADGWRRRRVLRHELGQHGHRPRCKATRSPMSRWAAAAYGLKIGHGGYMGSEISLLNCYLGDNTVAGVTIGNYNAIAITVIGGNIANCGKGIWVKHGGGMAIVGTGFQRQRRVRHPGHPDRLHRAVLAVESARGIVQRIRVRLDLAPLRCLMTAPPGCGVRTGGAFSS